MVSISCGNSGEYCFAIGISPPDSNTSIIYSTGGYGNEWGTNQLYSDDNIMCVSISGDNNILSIGYKNAVLGNIKIQTSDSSNYSVFQQRNVINGAYRDWGIYKISLSNTGQYQIACNGGVRRYAGIS